MRVIVIAATTSRVVIVIIVPPIITTPIAPLPREFYERLLVVEEEPEDVEDV